MAEAGAEVAEMRKELRTTMSGGAEQKGYASANGYGNSALPPPSAFDPDGPDGDAYGAFEQQRQAEIMHEQDEAIDGVFKTVGNLRQQADDMGRELEEQVELLEDVNQLTDRVQGKIQNGIMKVGWVIKNTEGASIIVHQVSRNTLAYYGFRDLVKLLYWRACLRVDTPTHPGLAPLNGAAITKSSFGIWLGEFVCVWSTTALDRTLEGCLLFFAKHTALSGVFDGFAAAIHTFLVASESFKVPRCSGSKTKTRE